MPPEECFVVEDAVSGIQAAKPGGMAVLDLSRAHDEELLAAAEPDVLVTSLDDVDLDALGRRPGGRGAPDRRRSRSTRGIAKADVRVVAARGRELELYFGRCLLLVDRPPFSPKVTIFPNGCQTPVSRVNARHLSEWSYGADRRLRLYPSCPTMRLAAMARGIDQTITWSMPKVAELRASS